MYGVIDALNFSPYPKNPLIALFFREIGLADDLGSGVKNVTQYLKVYSRGVPEFIEADIFKQVLPINVESAFDSSNLKCGEKDGEKLNATQRKIVEATHSNNKCTIAEMADFAGVKTRAIERNIRVLKDKGIIEREGADKGGKWIVKI